MMPTEDRKIPGEWVELEPVEPYDTCWICDVGVGSKQDYYQHLSEAHAVES